MQLPCCLVGAEYLGTPRTHITVWEGMNAQARPMDRNLIHHASQVAAHLGTFLISIIDYYNGRQRHLLTWQPGCPPQLELPGLPGYQARVVIFLFLLFFFSFLFCFLFSLPRGFGSDGIMDMSVDHPSTLQQIHLHFSPELMPRCQQHWGSRHLASSG